MKKYHFLASGVARQWDVARIYYDQMVYKGKHHNQAVCGCATHLRDRILAILKENRPYERRGEVGNPITASEAKAIIETRYTVPEEVQASACAQT